MKDTKRYPSTKPQPPPNSYYGRHFQKNKPTQAEAKKSTVSASNKYNQSQIALRREQIINNVRKNQETSIIKIEDSFADSLFSKNIEPQQQSKWLLKIAEIRQSLESARAKVIEGQKQTKQCEKELQEKKLRHASLAEKKEHTIKTLQQFTIDEVQESIQQSQSQHAEAKLKESEEQISILKADQETLSREIKRMEIELSCLGQEYRKLQVMEQTEETVEDLNDLTEQNNRIKQSITELEYDIGQLQTKISALQNSSSPLEQIYRRYTTLKERIAIQNMMKLVDAIMQKKEQVLKKQDSFQKNKALLKEKNKEREQIEKRVSEKQKQADRLTQEIVEKSNQLLSVSHEHI